MITSTLCTSKKKSNITQIKIILTSALLLLTLTIALLLPSNSFAESDITTTDMKIMGSVLSQADHYRIRGQTSEKHQQAITLYKRAAEQGSAVAQYWLGRMYYAGNGTKVDRESAENWLDLSAKQDYPPAKEFLFDVVLSDEVTDEDC